MVRKTKLKKNKKSRIHLTLSRLCTMKVQDMVDEGLLNPESVPAGSLNPTPPMDEFNISTGGILKLLKKLNPGKAAGPDKLKPLLLRELAEETAPIIQILYERSIQTGKLSKDWCHALVTPIFKKGTNHRLLTTDRFPTHAYCVRSLSISWHHRWLSIWIHMIYCMTFNMASERLFEGFWQGKSRQTPLEAPPVWDQRKSTWLDKGLSG